MKKTGSIRVNIVGENQSNYSVTAKDCIYQWNVPKSAVTDIREEVDWSGVEKGTPIVTKLNGLTSVGFLARTSGENKLELSSYREDAIENRASHVRNINDCMLLTDWLKMQEGNDE